MNVHADGIYDLLFNILIYVLCCLRENTPVIVHLSAPKTQRRIHNNKAVAAGRRARVFRRRDSDLGLEYGCMHSFVVLFVVSPF